MPFASKAQLRKFHELHKQGKITNAKLQEFVRATPDIKKLPERVSKKKSDGRRDLAIKGLI